MQQPQQPDQASISGPQSSLTVPEQKLDWPTFPTVQRDWYRLRRQVTKLANPISWARDLGWCMVTTVIGFVLGLITWIPLKSQLSRDAQFTFAPITSILVVGIIAAVLVGTLGFTMYMTTEKALRSDAKDILEFMDEMHKAPPPEPPVPGLLVRLWRKLFGRGAAATPSATNTGGTSPGAV
jgi:hypothetical protein